MTKSDTWGHASFSVQNGTKAPFIITVTGRAHWTLANLIQAGAKGCTAMDDPGSRLAAYIHTLPAIGIDIQTIHETHRGDFPGHHARYVLRSIVTCHQEVTA